MSTNIIDHQQEKIVTAEIRRLGRQELSGRSIQGQGTAATRLEMIEGFIAVEIGESGFNFSNAVDFAAPADATIMVGSLLHASYLVIYNPLFPSMAADIYPVQITNLGWSGLFVRTWLPYSLDPDDDSYQTPYTLGAVATNRLPDNQIRLACKVVLQQGISTTDTWVVYTYYQLRMTFGWSGV